MSKRILSLVLALVMVLGTFGTVFAAETAAVTVEKDAATFLKEAKILLGDDKGNLNLDLKLERRDMVILLSRLMGDSEVASKFPVSEDSPTWKDARTDAYYVPFYAWAQTNKFFAGNSEKEFAPRAAMTAQDYAVVLLRVLGYEADGHDAWKAALKDAKELGILKDVVVEDTTVITRGQMSVMTFNALSVKVKDSTKTLAETLNITMPEDPKADKLTAEVNDTENLAEVVVELSNAELADADKLEKASNYKLNDNNIKVQTAKVVGDDVVLTLAGVRGTAVDTGTALVKGRSYTLTVRGIDKDINKDYKFKAYDNAAPAIESVEVLGEYGIKVTTTEPVKDPQERNFQINGKRMSMKLEQYGKDIILTPYHNVSFDKDATELTVLELKDYAGYTSSLIREDIEIVKDDVAPKVVSSTRNRYGNSVTVVFDKDVYVESVGGYASYRSTGNISYRDGRQTVYADATTDAAKKVATNVVVYSFKNELPRNVEFTIEGVKNHSEVAMEKTQIVPTVSLDEDAAEVVNNGKRVVLNPTNNDTEVELTIKFDKDIDLSSVSNVYSDNFKLFKADNRGSETNNHIKNVKYNTDKYGKTLNDELVVTFDYKTTTQNGLEPNVSGNKKVNDYTLEITNLEDKSGNRIARSYIDFEVIESKGFVAQSVYANPVSGETEFTVVFSKPVNKADAEDERNYVFTVNGAKKDLEQLNGEAIVERDGYTVTLRVPEDYDYVTLKYSKLEILPRINSTGDQRISGILEFVQGTATRTGLEYIPAP